jgi:hypothetical protein
MYDPPSLKLRRAAFAWLAGRSAQPARRLVPGVGFEPTSPRFRRDAVTRSASQAYSMNGPPSLKLQRAAFARLASRSAQRARRLARTERIELPSPEWRSEIEPINYVRDQERRATSARRGLVRPRGFEPLVGRPAGFADAGFTDRWRERDACRGISLAEALAGSLRARAWLAGRSAGARRLEEGEGVEPSTVRSARFSRPVACRHAPPSVVPARFERATPAFGRRRSCSAELRDNQESEVRNQ